MTRNDNGQTSHEKNLFSAPKNFVVPFLLLSLRDLNLHGYKLIERLSELGFHSVDHGNVYRTLRQLERENLIASVWDTSSSGPAKRIYSLTEAGEKYLEAWAASLGYYQQMIDTFFSMYKNFMFPFCENNADNNKTPAAKDDED